MNKKEFHLLSEKHKRNIRGAMRRTTIRTILPSATLGGAMAGAVVGGPIGAMIGGVAGYGFTAGAGMSFRDAEKHASKRFKN